MSQPDYYPMTEKALVAACNQKQNRDPVMDLDEDAVWETLESLRQHGLVTTVLPGPGARTRRFKHEVETKFGWARRERAVIAELLLRGPQTVGELRTRCSRFTPFDDLEAVSIVLDNLAQRDTPLVAPMPREPGRSAIRYTHLLYPADETPQTAAPARMNAAPAAPGAQAAQPAPSVPAAADAAPPTGWQDQVDALQGEVADLHEQLADLSRRLEAIEQQLL